MAALHKAVAPRSVAKSAKKIGDAAKKGELVQMPEPKKRRPRGRQAKPPTTYTKAGAVLTVAEDLIQRTDFEGMWALKQAQIAYIFTSADRVAGGCDETTGVSRFPKKLTAVAGKAFDFVVMVSEPRWERLDDKQKRATVFHALSHAGQDDNGRWRIEKHDFAGFLSEVKRFGLWTERLSRPKQLGLFDTK